MLKRKSSDEKVQNKKVMIEDPPDVERLYDTARSKIISALKQMQVAEEALSVLHKYVPDYFTDKVRHLQEQASELYDEALENLDTSRAHLNQTGLEDLPRLALEHLSEFLSFEDVANVRLVSKSLLYGTVRDERFKTLHVKVDVNKEIPAEITSFNKVARTKVDVEFYDGEVGAARSDVVVYNTDVCQRIAFFVLNTGDRFVKIKLDGFLFNRLSQVFSRTSNLQEVVLSRPFHMQPSPLIPISSLLTRNSRCMTHLKLVGMKLSTEDIVSCQLIKMNKVEFKNCQNFAFIKSILENCATSLTTLNLESIEILPLEIDLKHLAELRLERCTGAEGIQALLTNCSNTLRSLNLIWCQYSIDQILTLPNLESLEVAGMLDATFNLDLMIQDSTRLKTLKLKNIVHNDDDHEFEFQDLNLEYLNVQYCEESDWITSLMNAASMKLTKLKLANVTYFPSELEDLPRLDGLRISNHSVGVQWSDLIEIAELCPNLRVLDIADLVKDEDVFLPHLQTFPHLSHLRKLTFRSSNYENLLLEMIQACTNLEAVHVPTKLTKSIRGYGFEVHELE